MTARIHALREREKNMPPYNPSEAGSFTILIYRTWLYIKENGGKAGVSKGISKREGSHLTSFGHLIKELVQCSILELPASLEDDAINMAITRAIKRTGTIIPLVSEELALSFY